MSKNESLPVTLTELLEQRPPIGARRAQSLQQHLAEAQKAQALEMTNIVLRFADGIVAVNRELDAGCIDLAKIELEIMARDVADFLGSNPLRSKETT